MANKRRIGTEATANTNVDNTIIQLDTTGANPRDMVREEIKVTAGYFTGAVGKISGSSQILTASMGDANGDYYVDVTLNDSSNTTQFAVAYGHYAGSGSISGSTGYGQTEAIYNYWAETLLPENEMTGGFFISSEGSDPAVASGKDEEIYLIVAERELMKDRLNPKNWTIELSGSNAGSTLPYKATSSMIHLTDDSADVAPTHTMIGDRYNIVSGALGTVVSASSARRFGFFYPDVGVFVFSGAELSRSIGGAHATKHPVEFQSGSQLGFGTWKSGTTGTASMYDALRMVNCLAGSGSNAGVTWGSVQLRNEEIQQSVSYFCRLLPSYMNFSNNPTFTSGSHNKLRHTEMHGDPQVFITGVGLYNGSGIMVATANLSKPLKKNFGTEATIKVKLTF